MLNVDLTAGRRRERVHIRGRLGGPPGCSHGKAEVLPAMAESNAKSDAEL
jgi:hypothetical protein